MNTQKWLAKNAQSLEGKTVALTGSTGGIGGALCRHLAGLGAGLILLDRDPQKACARVAQLKKEHPQIKVKTVPLDLEDEKSVSAACERMENEKIDVFIHNAGAYSIPRHKCKSGFDNVFMINFASPYYMINRLLPTFRRFGTKVIAVGSIAHNYSKTDPQDVDFSSRNAASRVYGNAKRYLMFALWELFEGETETSLGIAHPGITFTNITAHYPKLIFAIIKHPMKIIFMKPEAAALSIMAAVYEYCEYHSWIGPRIFGIWGKPKKVRLKTCSLEESRQIFDSAKEVLEKYK